MICIHDMSSSPLGTMIISNRSESTDSTDGQKTLKSEYVTEINVSCNTEASNSLSKANIFSSVVIFGENLDKTALTWP